MMTDLKALWALLLLSCSAAGRSLRTGNEISENLGGLSRFGGSRGAKFWSAGGDAIQQNALSFQVPMMTTTPVPTVTSINPANGAITAMPVAALALTTTAVPTVTSINPINGAIQTIALTTTYNPAMAALSAADAQAAAAREKALKAKEAAERAEEEAKKDEAEAALKAAEAAAATPKPGPPPPPPPPEKYTEAFNAVISNAATTLSETIKTAVTQAFATHGPPAMDAAVSYWASQSSSMPFCDELTTPEPPKTSTTTIPPSPEPKADANEMGEPATTTEKPATTTEDITPTESPPETTKFLWKLYAGNGYCIMRVTGVTTTTMVDLGGAAMVEPENIIDPSDFEFLRRKGNAPPGHPVRVLAHGDSKAVPAKEKETEAAKKEEPKKDIAVDTFQAKAAPESAECHMRRTECSEICSSDNSTVKNFDCKPAAKEAQYNCICGNNKLVVSSGPSGKGNEKQKEDVATGVKPQEPHKVAQSEREKQKPKPLSQPTSKGEHVEKGEHLEDKKIEVLPKAKATAMGEAAEGAIEDMKLPTIDGSEPYPISGPPPGVYF